MEHHTRTLEIQREEYSKRKFIATPLAGLIVWLLIGIVGMQVDEEIAALVIFIGSGSIVYLGFFLSRFTGENFFDKSKPKNVFDNLFLVTVAQALLAYAIAIPFYLQNTSSLPMSVGILTGLMWVPFSWTIKHWVGVFHTISRTTLILVLWYALPQYRFVAIPFAIVIIYAITLLVLYKRYQKVSK